MSQPLSPPDPQIEYVNELARSFWNSAILRAGIKLNIFSLLQDCSLTSEEIARRLEASPTYVLAFLEACVVLNLLEKHVETYQNSALTSKLLNPMSTYYVGDHALHHTNTWALWGRLDEIVKDGKSQLPFETGYVDAATYWSNYTMGQHNRASSGQARHLVENVDLRDKRKLLDLGGGAASYSIALCGANPQLSAVVVDQMEPLKIAKSLVEVHQIQDRITLLEGDFNTTKFGRDFDVVLLSGVILIKPEKDCRMLVSYAYDALLPGGLLIVQDYLRIDHCPERQRLDTLEHLYVMVAFDSGAADREGTEVAAWIEEVGFLKPTMIPLPTQLALITALKPPA